MKLIHPVPLSPAEARLNVGEDDNPYEQFNRLKRAVRLADTIEAVQEVRRVTELNSETAIQLAKRMGWDSWCIVAEIIKIKPPSEETQKLTVKLLEDRAEIRIGLLKEAFTENIPLTSEGGAQGETAMQSIAVSGTEREIPGVSAHGLEVA